MKNETLRKKYIRILIEVFGFKIDTGSDLMKICVWKKNQDFSVFLN